MAPAWSLLEVSSASRRRHGSEARRPPGLSTADLAANTRALARYVANFTKTCLARPSTGGPVRCTRSMSVIWIQRRRNMFWSGWVGGGGTGVRGHLTYKKRANQVQHKQQVIYSKHAVHLQLLIKSPIAINFKGKKVKTIFVF